MSMHQTWVKILDFQRILNQSDINFYHVLNVIISNIQYYASSLLLHVLTIRPKKKVILCEKWQFIIAASQILFVIHNF